MSDEMSDGMIDEQHKQIKNVVFTPKKRPNT